MTCHVYVDESKRQGYVLAASVHAAKELGNLRTMMRGLVLPAQHRIHMVKERDRRKRAIAAAICDAGVTATIYDAGSRFHRELDARSACLEALIVDIATVRDEALLVLEQDESLLDWDRRELYKLVRRHRARGLRYEHRRARADGLLSIPDIIAWCWTKGGDWRRRIEPAVTRVERV